MKTSPQSHVHTAGGWKIAREQLCFKQNFYLPQIEYCFSLFFEYHQLDTSNAQLTDFFFQFVVGGTVIISIIPRKFHKSYIVQSFEKQTKQVQRQCTRRGVPLFRLVLEFIRRFRNTLTINRRCFQFMLSVRFFLQAQIQDTLVSSTSNITYTLGGIKSFSLYWETGNQNKTVCLRLLKIQIKKNVYDIKVLFFCLKWP